MASNALAIHDGSVAMQVFGDEYAAIKNGIAANLTDAELDYLASVARSTGLSVLKKQIYGVKRKQKINGVFQDALVIQTGIDGYRVIAERSGKYGGQLGPFWCGGDGQWRDVWLDTAPPMAAKVGVIRKDFSEPLWQVATYASYAALYNGQPQGLWGSKADIMLAKCAESLALRKAFPDEMAGTYTDDEMEQANNPAPIREIRAASTPIERPVQATVTNTPRRAARTLASAAEKPQPNGPDVQRQRLIAEAAEKGLIFQPDETMDVWADVLDLALESHGFDFAVETGPNGMVTARALHNALMALPPRTVDAETGEVLDGEAREAPAMSDDDRALYEATDAGRTLPLVKE